uniref:Uncharacterized protein LOC111116128 isoform X3 n=1 Tax=Crassostrea virginica TaxID=6565 RepID=A0A8B8C555_CRAVI|nr:uncharacterized protein LOC111116128 isoform X3 [Crassostrea virginica]
MATKEKRHFTTVRDALDDPCTKLLQEVLRQHVPETDIHKLLNDPAKKRKIIQFVRNFNQESTLYPQTGVFSGTYADFDVSLLYVLIRNLTGIPDHNTGWGKTPDLTDNSIGAHVERIRLLRNKYAHGSTSQLTDKEFEKEWKNIMSCIQGIEKTFPGNNTTFQDAAQKLFDEAKNQANIGETLTKCKEDIAHTSTRVEGLHEELKNTQDELNTVNERLDGHDKLLQIQKKKRESQGSKEPP